MHACFAPQPPVFHARQVYISALVLTRLQMPTVSENPHILTAHSVLAFALVIVNAIGGWEAIEQVFADTGAGAIAAEDHVLHGAVKQQCEDPHILSPHGTSL